MKTAVINRKGSPLCAHPIHEHRFEGDDFLCDNCGEPRARHHQDGFIPVAKDFQSITPDARAQYRGPHPMFSRPGKERFNEENIKISPAARAYAARRRAAEARDMERVLR